MSLPEWMRNRTKTEDYQPTARSGRSSAVRRAIAAFARYTAQMLANDECASRAGLLQSIDARFKIIGLIGLLIAATLVHRLEALGWCYVFCILLAAMSRTPVVRFLGIWLFVPLFSVGIMLPATLNIVTPGTPALTISNSLAITNEGLLAGGRMVLRTAVCVSLMLLLTTTTSRPRLFRGLRVLGAPIIFVTLLNMMDRYLGLIVRATEEIHLARISRSIVSSGTREERAWAAAGIGSILRRSNELSNSVHLAMISRGYKGEIYLLYEPRPNVRDYLFLLTILVFIALMLLIG